MITFNSSIIPSLEAATTCWLAKILHGRLMPYEKYNEAIAFLHRRYGSNSDIILNSIMYYHMNPRSPRYVLEILYLTNKDLYNAYSITVGLPNLHYSKLYDEIEASALDNQYDILRGMLC